MKIRATYYLQNDELRLFLTDCDNTQPQGSASDTCQSRGQDTSSPCHTTGTAPSLSADEQRQLIRFFGCDGPETKRPHPPVLNLKTHSLQSIHPSQPDSIETFPVVAMKKSRYARFHGIQRGRRLSLCGNFRFRICIDPLHQGPRHLAPYVAAFFVDSDQDPVPGSTAMASLRE